MKTTRPLLAILALVLLTAGLAVAGEVAAGTCTAKAPSNACGTCNYESQCGGTDKTRLCQAHMQKACKQAAAPKPAPAPVAPKTAPEPETTPAAPAAKTTPAPPVATPPVIAITGTVKPKVTEPVKKAAVEPEAPTTIAPEAPATTIEPTPAAPAEPVKVDVSLDGTYVPTQSHGVLGLGAGFDIEGDYMHEAFSLGCTTTLALAPVKKDEAEVKLVERFGKSCRADARPGLGTTVGSIDTLQRGPHGEALELLVEMPVLTRVRRAFRAARLGDGDYKANDETWVQLRGTAAIIRRGTCLVLARMADRGVPGSAELRLIEVSGCQDIAPAPGAHLGEVEVASTEVIDAEEVTVGLRLELKGTQWQAARQKSGPPMGIRRGVTSNWTGAYDGPKGGTLTLMAPHTGTYSLNDGETTCQIPLELAEVDGQIEARVSTDAEARIRPVGCPAHLPGQLAFRFPTLKENKAGSLVALAHNGMSFSRPAPEARPAKPAGSKMMAASIRSKNTGTPVAASAAPGFASGGVKDALKAGKRAVDACYQRRVQMKRGLAGSLFLAWQVDASGNAFDVRVLKDSLEDGPTARCVVHAVRRMSFPAATDGSYEVRTPFRFTAY